MLALQSGPNRNPNRSPQPTTALPHHRQGLTDTRLFARGTGLDRIGCDDDDGDDALHVSCGHLRFGVGDEIIYDTYSVLCA